MVEDEKWGWRESRRGQIIGNRIKFVFRKENSDKYGGWIDEDRGGREGRRYIANIAMIQVIKEKELKNK